MRCERDNAFWVPCACCKGRGTVFRAVRHDPMFSESVICSTCTGYGWTLAWRPNPNFDEDAPEFDLDTAEGRYEKEMYLARTHPRMFDFPVKMVADKPDFEAVFNKERKVDE